MARSNEEIKVGVVVAVAVMLFLVALVFVGGVNLLRKKKVEYTTYFKFAGGLEPGSLVRFAGFKVGTVTAAALDPDDSTRMRIMSRRSIRTRPSGPTPKRAFLRSDFWGRITWKFPRAPAMPNPCPREARFRPWKLSNWRMYLIT